MNAFARLSEKVVSTYVEVFLAAWLAADALNASTAEIAALAAVPAAFTVIANGIPVVPYGLPFYADLGFRAIRTAAATAAMTVVKGGLASKVGAHTPALLPAAVDAPLAA